MASRLRLLQALGLADEVVDPELALGGRSCHRPGDVLHIPDGEATGPREADEEVKPGIGLGVRWCGTSLTLGSQTNRPTRPDGYVGTNVWLRARAPVVELEGAHLAPLTVRRTVAPVQGDRVSVDRELRLAVDRCAPMLSP